MGTSTNRLLACAALAACLAAPRAAAAATSGRPALRAAIFGASVEFGVVWQAF